jgi:ribosomal protein S18 acetylase RimI-like enzyme
MRDTPTALEWKVAEPAEAAEVAGLLREAFAEQARLFGLNPQDHPYAVAWETAERVRQRMDDGNTVLLVRRGDQAVGTIAFRLTAEDPIVGYFGRLGVHPAAQGQGLGVALVRYAEEQLSAQGARKMTLAMAAETPGLQRFYERLDIMYLAEKPTRITPWPSRIWRRT